MTKGSKTTKNNERAAYYMPDWQFYALWKYSAPQLEPEREYTDFKKLAPAPHENGAQVFEFLSSRLKDIGTDFHGFHLYSDAAENEIYLPPTAEALKEYPEKERVEVIEASRKALASRHGDAFSPMVAVKLLPFTRPFLNQTYFYTNIPEKDRVAVRDSLNGYIKSFLNDELTVRDQNFFVFEKQKRTFFDKVRVMDAIRKYGKNFVITHGPLKSSGSDEDAEFLFTQTLYALEELEYLQVTRLWHNAYSFEHIFNATVVLLDKGLEELSEDYRTKNPTVRFEKLDAKRGVLHFAGKQIAISKSGKETYPLQLLQTLAKKPEHYWFEDEVLADWSYTEDEIEKLPKNRVYQAALKVNKLIAQKAQMDDFLEHTTEKVRINPKYLKSS